MNTGVYITHLVYVIPGKESSLAQYESRVLPLLDRHNGKIIARVRPSGDQILVTDSGNLHELHVVHFATENDFENYLRDPERLKFSHLKEQAIERTVTIKGIAL
jgi:uncharacterized protein (DUF1330 family)